MQFIALALLASAGPQAGSGVEHVIFRHDSGGVTDENEGIVEIWVSEGDELVSGSRRLPATDMAALRARILERHCLLETFPADPGPECFEPVGITAENFEARRSEWMSAALSEFWKDWAATPALLADAASRLEWATCRPEIVRWTCGGGIHSVHASSTEVELRGDPPIRLSAWSELPGRLPWIVRVGDQRWASADVAISRALMPFAPVSEGCAKSLDGDAYWQGGFWSDRGFWRRPSIGGVLDDTLCRSVYERLEGWSAADGFLSVESTETGMIGYTRPALEFDLVWRSVSPIERVVWSNPRTDRTLSHSWIDLMAVWQDAKRTVLREAWIDAWKRSGAERTLTLELVGDAIGYDAPLEDIALPAWRSAGFEGIPDWKVEFRRGREAAASVYLSREQPGALIVSAHAGPGEHWLDAQAFKFHPKAKPRSFGHVDAAGRFEMRSLR